MEGLKYMLGEIKKSVDTASRNPNRFKLTNVEIQGRRGWMDSVGRRVETLRTQVWGLIRVNTGATEFTSTSAKPLTTTTQGANMTANMTTNMTTPKPTTTKTKTNANMDSFIASETAQQQQMIVRQDQELDVLGASSLLPLPRLSLPLSLSFSFSLSLSSKLPLTPGAARFVRIRQAPTCYGSENSARRWARSSTRRASSWTSLATKWWGHRPGACSGTRPLTADVDWLAATG